MKNKILVTGASSAIGYEIYKNLKTKFDVFGCYNKNLKKKNELIKINLEKQIKFKNKIDIIIHLASKVPSDGLNVKNYNKNLLITKNLLKLAKLKKIKKFIFLSTLMIYEKNNSKVVSNLSKPKTSNLYALSKLQSEKMIKEFCIKNNIEYIILRVPNIVGLNNSKNFFNKIIYNIKKNRRIIIYNYKKKFNYLIHFKNLTEIILSCVNKKYIGSYNLCASYPLYFYQIMNLLYKNFKKKVIITKSKKSNKIYQTANIRNKFKLWSVRKSINQIKKFNL